MAEEKEITRFEWDTTGAEAGAGRLQALYGQLKTAQAAGQSTTGIEKEIQAELDGLNRLSGAKSKDKDQSKEQAGATDELLKSKEKLAQVVNMLGGSFAGMLGPLGSVGELIMKLNPATAGAATALAVFAAWSYQLAQVEQAAKAATQAQEALNEAVAKGQGTKQGTVENLAGELEKLGALTPATERSGFAMQRELRSRYGIPEGEAVSAAAMAAASGWSLEDAAVLRQLRAQGVQSDTPDDAARALTTAKQRGDYERLLGQAQQRAATQAGQAARREVRALPAGGPELSPERIAYDEAVAAGLLPQHRDGMGGTPRPVTYDEWLAGLSPVPTVADAMATYKAKAPRVSVWDRVGGQPTDVPGSEAAIAAAQEVVRAETGDPAFAVWRKRVEQLRRDAMAAPSEMDYEPLDREAYKPPAQKAARDTGLRPFSQRPGEMGPPAMDDGAALLAPEAGVLALPPDAATAAPVVHQHTHFTTHIGTQYQLRPDIGRGHPHLRGSPHMDLRSGDYFGGRG